VLCSVGARTHKFITVSLARWLRAPSAPAACMRICRIAAGGPPHMPPRRAPHGHATQRDRHRGSVRRDPLALSTTDVSASLVREKRVHFWMRTGPVVVRLAEMAI